MYNLKINIIILYYFKNIFLNLKYKFKLKIKMDISSYILLQI